MSCSRTQHGGGRSRTPDLSLRSPTLYHWATALPHNKYIENLIRTQGRVTPKCLIRTGRNSYSSEILCLTWLPACLTKIRSTINELAWTHHFPIISQWEFFRRTGAPNSVGNGPIWPQFELIRDLYLSSLPSSLKQICPKTTEKRWIHRLPHYKSMCAVCCHVNHSFDSICPKTLCSLSPIPMVLQIQLYQDWPTGLRDIQVGKCGRRWRNARTADYCYIISSPTA